MRPQALAYTLISLAVIQLALPALVPPELVYDHRLSYEYFRDNHGNLDLALRAIKSEIRREGLRDYIILLGDSVTYGARTPPDQSLGAQLQAVAAEHGRPLHVFTLAQPSMQVGDTYTVILKLREHGISTRYVVSNLLYGGFVARTPFPPVVFWLERDLRRLDPEGYGRVRDHLTAARLDPLAKTPRRPEARFDRWVSQSLYPAAAPLAYRDFIRAGVLRLATGRDIKAETIDSRPWTQKTHLRTTLRQAEYQRDFADQAFDLTYANPQVYFLGRLIGTSRRVTPADAGEKILLFLSPVNQTLMEDKVTRGGYRGNLARLDAWFAAEPVVYRNLQAAVPDAYFADHLHLTAEGNRRLAEILWKDIQIWDVGDPPGAAGRP
jgi:hypothetical protein